MMVPLDDSLIGKQIDGRFLITHYLGMGGMGTAYRARQLDLSREVCIKFLKRDALSDVESIARFKREAKVLATLQHNNIVSCYAFGLFEDLYPYLVMEFVEGTTLKKLAQGEAFEWTRACRIVQKICIALGYAHQRGFIHRDIKPENVMITNCGGEESVKVVDFGLVGKQRGELACLDTLTDPSSIVGTVNYMAPEAFKGSVSDKSLDIYAVGCVLYELLSGHLPFDAENGIAVMYKHANERLPSLPGSLKPDDVRHMLEEIVWTATAVNSSDRFTSCEEISQLLSCLSQKTYQTGDLPLLAKSQSKNNSDRSSFAGTRTTLISLFALTIVLFFGWPLLRSRLPQNAKTAQSKGGTIGIRQISNSAKNSTELINNLSSLSINLNELHHKWLVRGVSQVTDAGLLRATGIYFESLQQFLDRDAATLTGVHDSKIEPNVKDICKKLTELSACLERFGDHYLIQQALDLQSDLLVSFQFYKASQVILDTGKPLPIDTVLVKGNLADLRDFDENVVNRAREKGLPYDEVEYLVNRLRPALPQYPLFNDGGRRFCYFVLLDQGRSRNCSPSLTEIAENVKTDSRQQLLELLGNLADIEIRRGSYDTAHALLIRIKDQCKSYSDMRLEQVAKNLCVVGDYDNGLSVLQAALTKSFRRENSLEWCQLQCCRAEILLDCDKTAVAQSVLAETVASSHWKAILSENARHSDSLFGILRSVARQYYRLHNYVAAEKFFRQAWRVSVDRAALQPQQADCQIEWSQSLWNCGRRREAELLFDADLKKVQADVCLLVEKLLALSGWYGRNDENAKALTILFRAEKVLSNQERFLPSASSVRVEDLFHRLNVELAQRLELTGSIDRALAINCRLLSNDFSGRRFASSEHFSILLATARMYRRLGQIEKALQTFHQFVDINQEKRPWSQVEFESLETLMQELTDLSYRFAGTNELRKYVLEKRQIFARVDPYAESLLLLWLAQIALLENDLPGAREYIDRATPGIYKPPMSTREPYQFHWTLRTKLSSLESQLGNTKKADQIAVPLVEEALKDQRQLEAIDTLCWRADFACAELELDRAVEILQKANSLKVTPGAKIDRINMRLAATLSALGRKDEARKIWNETYAHYMLAKVPDNVTLAGIDSGYETMGLARSPSEGRLHLLRARSRMTKPGAPDSLANIHCRLAVNAQQSGHEKQARELIDRAIRSLRDSKYSSTWGPRICRVYENACFYWRGVVCRQQGDLQSAVVDLRKSVECPRPAILYLLELAEVEGELGNKIEAAKAYKRALAIADSIKYHNSAMKHLEGLIYLSYACWLYETGRLHEARDAAHMAETLCGVLLESRGRESLSRNLPSISHWYKSSNFQKLSDTLKKMDEADAH